MKESSWNTYHLSRITDILHFLQLQEDTNSHLEIYKNIFRIYQQAEPVLRFSILQSLEQNQLHHDDINYLKEVFSQHLSELSKTSLSDNIAIEWALILRWLVSIDDISSTKKMITSTMQIQPEISRKYAPLIFHRQETWALHNIWVQQ